MARLSLFSLAAVVLPLASAQTIYRPGNQVIMGGGADASSAATPTTTALTGAITFTGAAAYNPTTLAAPAAPTALNKQFTIQLFSGGMNNLSIPLPGNYMGFSVEMSVFNQYLGKNSSLINPPFLNLVANMAARQGSMQIRVGGNSQETAELVESIPNGNGSILSKDLNNIFNHNTPPIEYTDDLFYMMANISNFVNVDWHLGIPFFTTQPVDFNLTESSERILGSRLLGLQAGNEPDLYAQGGRNHRQEGYAPSDYVNEIGSLIQQASTAGIVRQRTWLVPSISSTAGDPVWGPDQVWNTGIVQKYIDNLYAVTVERYPKNNCAALFNTGGTIVVPQDALGDYLNHNSVLGVRNEYLSGTAVAVAAGKPMILFETNTASCSGFAGISDAFVGALWGVDWALSFAAGNFSGLLFHFGGQSSFYNPFTPPPGNQTKFRQWTVGPTYYSSLVVAEVIGKSNKSQIVDLQPNNGDPSTPAFAIYEEGVPKKVLIINYNEDPSGNSALTATVAIGGLSSGQPAANPSSVKVKRLSASSVTAKGAFTWAGQTFGNAFQSDGRMMGEMSADTVNCDTNNGCPINVPAPGIALVFLDDASYQEVSPDPSSTQTFATTALQHPAQTLNTVVIDPSVLATSNGHGNLNGVRYATSPGSRGSAAVRAVVPSFVAFATTAACAIFFVRRW